MKNVTNIDAEKDLQPKKRGKVTAKKPKIAAYPCRDLYSKILEARLGGLWLAEFPFHPKRKWRFDYANPDAKVAIEIDGGLYNQYKGMHAGRHSGGLGQKEDFVKMNAAAELGWVVLHYTPSEKMKTSTLTQIYLTVKTKTNNQSNDTNA